MDVGEEQDPQEAGDRPPEGGEDGEQPDASGVLAAGPAAAALGAEDAEEEASRSGWCDGIGSCDVPSCDFPSCDGCDVPGCDCNLLLRLSTLLAVAAALVPGRAGRRPVLALLRFYRRRLTRFTPACPSTPSCSAYAVRAVQDLGARRGLAAAARRVRACGPTRRRSS
jgi:putative component of membrane protein insertase Oxa1/YidC/SpoIIIJ protein YidD